MTAEPEATEAPAAGFWPMTVPAGTVALACRVTAPTARPALWSAALAAPWLSPARSGTVTGAGVGGDGGLSGGASGISPMASPIAVAAGARQPVLSPDGPQGASAMSSTSWKDRCSSRSSAALRVAACGAGPPAKASRSATSGDRQPVAATRSPTPAEVAAARSAHKVSPAAMPPEPNSLTSRAFKENRRVSGTAEAASSRLW